MAHYVYKYVLCGEVIYVGKTQELEKRIAAHGRKGDNIDTKYFKELYLSDIFFIEFDNPLVCDVAETYFINKYNPRLNKAKKIEKDFPFEPKFEEDQWEVFVCRGIGPDVMAGILAERDAEIKKLKSKLNKNQENVFKKPNSDYYRLDLIVRETVSNGKVGKPKMIEAIKTDYKSYLQEMAWENHTSITKYIHKLIDADMEQNKYKKTSFNFFS